jgi:hypothetical protein
MAAAQERMVALAAVTLPRTRRPSLAQSFFRASLPSVQAIRT